MSQAVAAVRLRRVRLEAESGEGPERILDDALAAFEGDETICIVDFALPQYWHDRPDPIALVALYHLQRGADGAVKIAAAVVEAGHFAADIEPALRRGEPLDETALRCRGVPLFALDDALPLQPVAIPKPWGQEIWYTGIERRGVAMAGPAGCTVPLPWLLALAPRRILGGAREPILLKILDPLPAAVFGDLYFEMHQQKQEVYVVTAIDAQAWPDGRGAIRFGFDAALRATYDDDRRFLADYLDAVRAYRAARQAIDRQLDQRRALEGVALDAPLPASTLQTWLADLPADTLAEERALRAAMERFTGMRPLQLGDVVKVPCLVPHSLQHGVRTVEFQTPVYERLILSFAQKVLTQADWDTEAAAELLRMDPPAPDPWAVTGRGEGWVEERIVEFDDFEVRRTTLQPGATRRLDGLGSYGLLMAVGAGLELQGAALPGDAAVLLPAAWAGADIHQRGASPGYLLLATPRSDSLPRG